jgi:DNA-directed RNA polymerase subunit F
MVPKDPIGKVEDLISSQSKDITYYTVCKKLERKELKPIEDYEKELKSVRKKVREVAPEAQSLLDQLLGRMKKLDYSLISEDVKREYGHLICSATEIFYYGILKGIDSAIDNKKENIDNLKIALEYLMSENRLERSLETYLKRVEEKFHNETGYTISKLLEGGHKIPGFIRNKDIRDRNVGYLLKTKAKDVLQYLNTFTKLSMEESEKVADVVKNLVKHPGQYKKDFGEYIGYKS